MNIRTLTDFLFSRHSLRPHLVLSISSFATSLAALGLLQYQSLTLADLFVPTGTWIIYWVPVALIWYGSWISWSFLLVYLTGRDPIEVLTAEAYTYLPWCLSICVWGKHLDLPSTLMIILPLASFISLKFWGLCRILNPDRWRVSNQTAMFITTLFIALFAMAFSVLGGLRYMAFRAFIDFSIFVQQIWSFSHFRYSILVAEGWLPFGNHFSPVLFLMAPFYWIWENPIMIIIVQNAVVALGILPVYRIARDQLDSALAGLVFGAIYLIYPAIQFSSLGDFHESLLISTPLLFAFYYLYKGRMGKTWLCILLVLMCKEDTPVLVFMFGVYTWYAYGLKKHGLGFILIAVFWLVISVGIIIPLSQGGANWYLQFTPDNSSEVTGASLSYAAQLKTILSQLLTLQNVTNSLHLLIPLGGLILLAPIELLTGLPTLLVLMIYTGPPFGLVGSIYTWHIMAVIPTLFIAAIFGMKRLMDNTRLQAIFGKRYLRPVCLVYICICSMLSSVSFGAYPYSLTYQSNDFMVDDHDRIGHDLLKMIPSDATVSTTGQLSAHLGHRKHLYTLPLPIKNIMWRGDMALLPEKVDYIVADTSFAVVNEMMASQRSDFVALIRQIGSNPDYATIAAEDGYIIYAHKDLVDSDAR